MEEEKKLEQAIRDWAEQFPAKAKALQELFDTGEEPKELPPPPIKEMDPQD